MNLSDIEISSFHQGDSTTRFQDFKRDNVLFLVNPNHLFDPVKDEGFTYYFEVFQNLTIEEKPLAGKWILTAQNKDKNFVYNEEREFSSTYSIKPFWEWIPISQWDTGTYTLSLKLCSNDNSDEPVASREELIFIQDTRKAFQKLKSIRNIVTPNIF